MAQGRPAPKPPLSPVRPRFPRARQPARRPARPRPLPPHSVLRAPLEATGSPARAALTRAAVPRLSAGPFKATEPVPGQGRRERVPPGPAWAAGQGRAQPASASARDAGARRSCPRTVRRVLPTPDRGQDAEAGVGPHGLSGRAAEGLREGVLVSTLVPPHAATSEGVPPQTCPLGPPGSQAGSLGVRGRDRKEAGLGPSRSLLHATVTVENTRWLAPPGLLCRSKCCFSLLVETISCFL